MQLPREPLQVIYSHTRGIDYWLARGYGAYLFQPDGDDELSQYDLESVIHLFMSRMKISPTETLLMSKEKRDNYLRMELEVMKKESENNE